MNSESQRANKKMSVQHRYREDVKMKNLVVKALILSILFSAGYAIAQDQEDTIEGLDLQAVSELFKDSENLEEFEKTLNDPETGINNLDLDENGEVDFIRVVEEVADDTHLIILQVPLGEDEYQDVATIEVEKTGDDAYNMQVHGNEDFYGPDYYIAPTVVHVHSWPVIRWMYRPGYHPYRSVYVWGRYPRWWKPWKPVKVRVYHTRVGKYRTRNTFVVTRTSRVRTVHKVRYTPRKSVRVKVRVVRPARTRARRRPRK